MIDKDILESVGIDCNICCKYDDMYFPFIIVWYSTVHHKSYYQVFYDRISALHFSHVLANRGKNSVVFSWNTSSLAYQSIAV